MDWRVERRQSSPEDKGYSEGTHTIHLPAQLKGARNPVRQDLQRVGECLLVLNTIFGVLLRYTLN